jgi:serine acetyltransferase
MVQFQTGRRRHLARAVVVGIRFEAVVEDNVPIVFGVRAGGAGQDQQPKQTEESDGDTEEV